MTDVNNWVKECWPVHKTRQDKTRQDKTPMAEEFD